MRLLKITGLIAALLLISACSLFSTGGPLAPTPTPLPDLAATLTALAPPTQTVTSTAQPTAAATATLTATSGVPVVQITPVTGVTGAPTLPAGVRVSFDRFATAETINGTLAGGEIKRYTLRVSGGQVMMVGVSSPENDVYLGISTASGAMLLNPGMGIGSTAWQGRLPSTQDYSILVISRGAATTFTLGITIPENIQFAAGAVSATRAYPIAANDTHTFLLRALQGQTMTARITSPDTVLLGIYGYDDGQPYKRTSVGEPNFSFELPATQDYVIQAQNVEGFETDFELEVTVE